MRRTTLAAFRATALAAAAALATACGGDAPTTPRETEPGYDPRAFAFDENGALHGYLYHWPVGRTVRVYVDVTAQPSGSDLPSAVLAGAALWAATVRNGEVSVALVGAPTQADVVVH